MFRAVLFVTNTVSTHTYTAKIKCVSFPRTTTLRDLGARGLAHSGCLNLFFPFTLEYMCFTEHGKSGRHTLSMLLRQYNVSFNNLWELYISTNPSP